MIKALKSIILIVFIGTTWISMSFAQDLENLTFEDQTFDPFIKTVQFRDTSYIDQFSLPIVSRNGRLLLSFDDLSEDTRDFQYTFIHCNKNWERTNNLPVFDYLDGFDDARIPYGWSSRVTDISYMHYNLTLPNDDMKWKISGNYLLVVWETYGDLVMTKRFIVSENKVLVDPKIIAATRGEYTDTHHDLNFDIDRQNLIEVAPNDVYSAGIIQNFDWNTAYWDVKARSLSSDRLRFNYYNTIVFPSIRIYRLIDLRSTLNSRFGVGHIFFDSDTILMESWPQRPTGYNQVSTLDDDINGNFGIDNYDRNNAITESQYVNVKFFFEHRPPDINEEFFLIGRFNDYKKGKENQFIYDPSEQAYVCEILMKQGVYEYTIGQSIDRGPIEYYETEALDYRANQQYTIVIYERTFNARYDKVVGFIRFKGAARF